MKTNLKPAKRLVRVINREGQADFYENVIDSTIKNDRLHLKVDEDFSNKSLDGVEMRVRPILVVIPIVTLASIALYAIEGEEAETCPLEEK